MSYILDALRKTEAEQDPVAAANLALNQQRNQRRYRVIGILVTAALLANAAVLVWLFGPSQPAVQQLAQAVSPPAESSEATGDRAAAVAADRPEQTPARPDPVSSRQTVVEPRAEPAPRIRSRLADLPAAVRDRFPGLAFSTHIYADDSSLRAVVVNGTRLVEGDEIDGAAVERITEDGVVLAFENYLVEIPVVADWQ